MRETGVIFSVTASGSEVRESSGGHGILREFYCKERVLKGVETIVDGRSKAAAGKQASHIE